MVCGGSRLIITVYLRGAIIAICRGAALECSCPVGNTGSIPLQLDKQNNGGRMGQGRKESE
jgi:hypothetical protein